MKSSTKYISIEHFKRAVDYLKDNVEKRIGFIGGEPTLHPHLIEFIDYALNQRMDILLFSNGLIPESVGQALSQYDPNRLAILLNLNDYSFYPAERLVQIERTMARLQDKVELGYTIFALPFSLDFHRSMILKHNLKRSLRLGLGSPIATQTGNYFLKENEMIQLGPMIVENVECLERDDIMVHFDCGFFMCLFNADELGVLAHKSMGFRSSCQPIIDIDPDLNAHCCFPLTSLMDKPLMDYPEIKDLVTYFSKRMRGIKIFGNNGKCMNCKYLHRGQCSGWCVGRISHTDPELQAALMS